MIHNALRLFVFAILSLVTGCASLPHSTPEATRTPSPLEETWYDVDIPMHDGTLIRATIFQPRLAAGETAPMLIHAHGFGLFRMSGPLSLYGTVIPSGISAKQAWKRGYWVISYDERGHGGSEGMIRVMDPEREVRDVSTMIDWAMTNISRLSMDKPGDPKVGMIGESYGGGAQLMASARDARIDAIVPFTTWNSFTTSLAPNKVPKSGWLNTLIAVANIMNPGNVEPFVNRAYWEARDGKVSPDIFEFLDSHSPSHDCAAGLHPMADVLFIQGMRDVLFPLNEASRNYSCARASGRDVRLLATRGGHLLPFAQWSATPGYDIENTVHCGSTEIDTRTVIQDWFDEKLKGQARKASYLPQICIAESENAGSVYREIPHANTEFRLPKVTLDSNFTGFFEFPITPASAIAGWFTPPMHAPEAAAHARLESAWRPAFVPLKTLRGEEIVTGLPEMTVSLTSTNPDAEPFIFVGVAVKRANNRRIELINDQVTPLRGNGMHQTEMAGVAARLHKDDILGLLVYGYNEQYSFSHGQWFSGSQLEGAVRLPMHPGNR